MAKAKNTKDKHSYTTVTDLGLVNPILVENPPETEVVEEKCDEQCENCTSTPKVSYLQCPFCNTKSFSIQGRDPTSTWCEKCGRCYSVVWYTD